MPPPVPAGAGGGGTEAHGSDAVRDYVIALLREAREDTAIKLESGRRALGIRADEAERSDTVRRRPVRNSHIMLVERLMRGVFTPTARAGTASNAIDVAILFRDDTMCERIHQLFYAVAGEVTLEGI